MHPSGRFNENSLIEILRKAFPKEDFKLVHRLDANTTGLVLIAKNKASAAEITKQFESKKVKKEYLALVEGRVKEDKFSSSTSISVLKTSSGGRKTVEDGEEAYTEFEVLERRANTTLLKVRPFSGRTNQIRIHLAELGHPIVGDVGYKDVSYFKNNPLTYPKDCLFLHAWNLTVNLNKLKFDFTAPIPAKFSLV
jgi:23S rRNA pseudouridine1911/1915/1917 synthase